MASPLPFVEFFDFTDSTLGPFATNYVTFCPNLVVFCCFRTLFQARKWGQDLRRNFQADLQFRSHKVCAWKSIGIEDQNGKSISGNNQFPAVTGSRQQSIFRGREVHIRLTPARCTPLDNMASRPRSQKDSSLVHRDRALLFNVEYHEHFPWHACAAMLEPIAFLGCPHR